MSSNRPVAERPVRPAVGRPDRGQDVQLRAPKLMSTSLTTAQVLAQRAPQLMLSLSAARIRLWGLEGQKS
jgi:hypothetical protein